MNNDKIVTPSFCYILAANFLLFFAFYLILPILPFYLKEEFMIGKSMIGFILSCYTLAALCIRPFAGYLLDTFARRPLYLVAYFIFTAIFGGYMVATALSLFIPFLLCLLLGRLPHAHFHAPYHGVTALRAPPAICLFAI